MQLLKLSRIGTDHEPSLAFVLRAFLFVLCCLRRSYFYILQYQTVLHIGRNQISVVANHNLRVNIVADSKKTLVRANLTIRRRMGVG